MKQFRFISIAICVFAISLSAHAQATRTWVSGVGDDANPCSRTAPCKTFAGAISKTAAAGEISVLDPGGFGAVTITKAITINGRGTLGGILASLVNGIIINLGASGKVYIHDVSINGAGNGLNGIQVLTTQGAFSPTVVIENCEIYGFTQRGINIINTNGTRAAVHVINTTIRDVAQGGIQANPSGVGSNVHLTLQNVRIHDAGADAVDLNNHANAEITDSVFTQNINAGVHTRTNTATANVGRTAISRNQDGIVAEGGSTVRLFANQIVDNFGTAITNSASTVISSQNNMIIGTSGVVTPNGQQ